MKANVTEEIDAPFVSQTCEERMLTGSTSLTLPFLRKLTQLRRVLQVSNGVELEMANTYSNQL